MFVQSCLYLISVYLSIGFCYPAYMYIIRILICLECLTLCLPVSSADNLGKQFGPRSGSKLFDILMVFLTDFFQKVNFEKNKKTITTKKRHKNYPKYAMS